MRIHTQKPSQPQQEALSHPTRLTQHMNGNQAVRALPHANAEGCEAEPVASAPTTFAYDFSRIPSHSKAVAPPIVHEVLRSPGQPLDPAVRSFMELRFGNDFSRVRVHTDLIASRSADAVAADAYTVGSDVVFGSGRYAPTGRDGQRLLAHELAHVAQQRDGGRVGATIPIGKPGSLHEHEADRAVHQLVSGAIALPQAAAPLQLSAAAAHHRRLRKRADRKGT